MAMAWDFILGAGQSAIFTLNLSNTDLGTGGLLLSQVDPDSNETIYFTGSMDITGGGAPVPEPGTFFLLVAGLVALGVVRGKKTV